ncbi:type III polyketide synthase [Paenibacillus senegalensis]|uniref:type III polyketide synthase n=1 Tax=Paenibacillus senegalensis TaxID=1465766 RepID=UPI000287C9F1|nr:type III polyketide synthase [Paenibacillus senegalensis]
MSNYNSYPALLGIGTAVPEHRVDQQEAAERIAAFLEHSPSSARWAKRIFRQVAVDSRYTCEASLAESGPSRYLPNSLNEQAPSTSERMKSYQEHSVPLAANAAREALHDSGTAKEDITHLMAVSCTGMFLPGLDVALIRGLGLPSDIKRLPLTFMGCAAGVTAMRTAADLVKADPNAKVLIVCVELCTLHVQPSGEKEALFGAAFFGDGASACVIGRAAKRDKGLFHLGNGRTALFPAGGKDMVWTLADFGFDLYLSPAIPELIGKYLPDELDLLLQRKQGESHAYSDVKRAEASEGEQSPLRELELWAIHPGGKGIIDGLQSIYKLEDRQTAPSREVLRRYGNMSSATILFVLQRMLKQIQAEEEESSELRSRSGIAIGFGPGLHAELLELTYLPSAGSSGSAGSPRAANQEADGGMHYVKI